MQENVTKRTWGTALVLFLGVLAALDSNVSSRTSGLCLLQIKASAVEREIQVQCHVYVDGWANIM